MRKDELIARLQQVEGNPVVYAQVGDEEPGPVIAILDLTGGLIIGAEDDNGDRFNDMGGDEEDDAEVFA